jgi:general secretion pathway protein H
VRILTLHHKQSGFTLIEIMVVVIIIAVMSVAVVSSLNGNSDRAARLQASRFMAVVNEVRDEAIIAGDNFVLIVDDNAGTYHFESTRSQQASAADTLLKSRLVDKKVTLDWEVYEVFESDGEIDARVLITSLGEITPFEARFKGTELSYVVLVNQQGQLERVDKKAGAF